MAYTIDDLNRDLRRDLAAARAAEKKRITFYREGSTHGKKVKEKNRSDRRSARAALRRGQWD